ncbi:MAG TPA: hypothetical protein PKI61_02220 [bacterium]|nr:hypothetical protein [bacterium]HPT29968.1 hypothetical protein [bacterium]
MLLVGKLAHYASLGKTNLKIAAKLAWGLTYVRVYILVAGIINLLDWVGSFLLYRAMGPNLTVLHYNVDFGIDLVGQRQKLFLNPAIGLTFILLDFLFLLFWTKQKNLSLVSHVLLATAILVNALLLLSLLAVYLINFR